MTTQTQPEGFRGRFLREAEARTPYGSASGILEGIPDAVAVPADPADVATLVAWAARTGTPLIPRGAGTGMPGGNVGSGVAVDLVHELRQVRVSGEARLAVVQPGVTLAELNAVAAGDGLHFPVDPSSGDRCTLGGMLANNSSGSHSVKHGSTRQWVREMEIVLADGTPARVRRGEPPEEPELASIVASIDARLLPHREAILSRWPRVRKNSSGYALKEYLTTGDVIDLLVGSEGTLALITGATLSLAPVLPCQGVVLAEFASLEAAGEAVLAIVARGPATCEMLDRTFLDLVREGGDLDYPLHPDIEAILLVEMEGDSDAAVLSRLEEIRSLVEGSAVAVSLATDPEEQHRFWKLRHAASPIIAARATLGISMQFIEDGVVPLERLPDYVRLLRRTLAKHHLPAVIFGHAGDGNIHVNPLVDVRRPSWHGTLEAVLDEIASGIAELGGTLSGEHGDGRLRAPHLETIWGPEMVGHFRAVKAAFDPAGILNPGVILPLPGQRPFDAIRSYPTS